MCEECIRRINGDEILYRNWDVESMEFRSQRSISVRAHEFYGHKIAAFTELADPAAIIWWQDKERKAVMQGHNLNQESYILDEDQCEL